jgi:hypothetical protein
MSEELEQQNDGTWSGLKKTIIGVATTAVMGLGTWGVTQITGGDKEESTPVQQAAPVINLNLQNNNNVKADGNGGTKVIERVVEKQTPAPAPKPKKKEGDEFKEAPAQW